MDKSLWLSILLFCSLFASAASKDTGSTVLKDVQPAGTTDKNHKHQQYDLTLSTGSKKDYTCRTNEKSEIKATDFVVGSTVTYEFKDNKGKVRTAAGKKVDCTIVRVANSTDSLQ